MDEATKAILSVSGVLFGFLFAGFWWILNRELGFEEEERHFKLSTGILMLSIFLLGIFGIIIPLKRVVGANPALLMSYRGVLLAIIATYGYMLTEFGHYSVFQFPKYKTNLEWFFFLTTVLVMAALALKWWVFR